jgi:hypothetical protein
VVDAGVGGRSMLCGSSGNVRTNGNAVFVSNIQKSVLLLLEMGEDAMKHHNLNAVFECPERSSIGRNGSERDGTSQWECCVLIE